MEDVTSELPIQIDGKKYPKISLVVYPHITRRVKTWKEVYFGYETIHNICFFKKYISKISGGTALQCSRVIIV